MNWKGKKVLITAGPTQEAIDPVRFISNHSSGKMGYAIAEQLNNLGAQVTLVSGPTNLTCSKTINKINIKSSDEMFDACKNHFTTSDMVIFAAAVADYKPSKTEDQKIKKSDDHLNLELTKTVDIAGTLGKLKTNLQFTVGFALETNDELSNAKGKLKRKNFDMIVLNSLNDNGAGFGHDTNKITIVTNNKTTSFELKSKAEVAKDIIDYISDLND